MESKEIVINSRKWGAVKNPASGKFLELDVWIPDHNLIFEFQDSYHYTTTWYSHSALNEQEIVRNNASTFITVPCWWNGELETLKTTIAFYRPDLIIDPNNDVMLHDHISLNPPHGFFKTFEVPDVGELMLASFPVDINFVETISCHNQWWIGEKYDGIRSVWNPNKHQLYTRHGRPLPLNDSISNSFPSSFLDGELWFGRGMFSYVIKLLTESPELIYLSFMRLIVFDIPFDVRELPFEERYTNLLNLCNNIFLIPAPRILCETKKQINYLVKIILDNGGEGIIAQQPKSLYIPGRSSSLLKVKSTRVDQEGLVMEIKDNEFLKLKLPRGDVFSVPFQNLQIREEKVQVGDIVSFSYDSFSRRSIPINVKIFRIRKDLEWEQVIESYRKDSTSKLNSILKNKI